jgi:hypothetical protein
MQERQPITTPLVPDPWNSLCLQPSLASPVQPVVYPDALPWEQKKNPWSKSGEFPGIKTEEDLQQMSVFSIASTPQQTSEYCPSSPSQFSESLPPSPASPIISNNQTIGYLHTYDKSIACNNPSCSSLAFSRLADFRRHFKEQHNNKKEYFCSVVGCTHNTNGTKRSFGTRKDKRDEHMKNVHGIGKTRSSPMETFADAASDTEEDEEDELEGYYNTLQFYGLLEEVDSSSTSRSRSTNTSSSVATTSSSALAGTLSSYNSIVNGDASNNTGSQKSNQVEVQSLSKGNPELATATLLVCWFAACGIGCPGKCYYSGETRRLLRYVAGLNYRRENTGGISSRYRRASHG